MGEFERTLRRSFARFACKLKDDDSGGVCAYTLQIIKNKRFHPSIIPVRYTERFELSPTPVRHPERREALPRASS